MKNNRKIAIVGIGSGIGAADKGAKDGPEEIILKISKKYPKIPIFYKYYNEENAATDVLKRRANIHLILGELYKTIVYLKKNGYFIIVLTGDHTYVLSIQAALAADAVADNTLLYIDAHMDAHTPRSSQSKNPHGMPNSTILGYGGYKEWSKYMGVIKPRNFHLFGVRSFEPYEERILKKIGVGSNIHYMKELEEPGSLESSLMSTVSSAPGNYSLSIDVDAFDPKYIPGTGYREPNGIYPREILNFLNFAGKDKNCQLIEITEFNPHKDINKKSLNWIMRFVDAILCD